ncbi:hypothetical protein Q3G72_033453 [Acer saccharum]|nr:hypothetical protein Q3G72_033453 [Acer saccharum]
MVRFQIPTTNHIFPPEPTNCISNLLSKSHQCLTLLKLCSSTNHLSQIHAQIHVSGLQNHAHLLSELVRFCALSPSKNLSYARLLLYNSAASAPISWNMVIRGYASSDTPREAVLVFLNMKRRAVRPNKLTFPFLFKACAESFALEEGKQIHVEVVKCGLACDVYVNNNLVHFYGSCKKVLDARKVFDEMGERSVVSWNAVITACVESCWLGDAIGYFVKMMDFGFEPDETTMVVALSACVKLGNLSLGKWIHSQVIERGMVLNCQLGTALVDMYTKCGAMGYASIHDANDIKEVQDEVRKRLLELEPKRSGNLVIIANMYAEVGMWDKAANVRRVMKDVGLKKIGGESSIELGGSIRRFYSGDDSHVDLEGTYELLDSLNLHMKMESSQYAATTSTPTGVGVHCKEVVHEQRNRSQHSQLSCSATVKFAYCSNTQDCNLDHHAQHLRVEWRCPVRTVETNRYVALQNSSSSSANKPSENAACQKISESKV